MKKDIRKGIKSSFLYKRFAYNSEGFNALIKFLQDEGIFDKFCEEFDFSKSKVEIAMKIKPLVTINVFFGNQNEPVDNQIYFIVNHCLINLIFAFKVGVQRSSSFM